MNVQATTSARHQPPSANGRVLAYELAIRGLNLTSLCREAEISGPTATRLIHGRPVSERTAVKVARIITRIPADPGLVRLYSGQDGRA